MAQAKKTPVKRCYDLGPTQLYIEAENEDLLEGFENFLSIYAREDNSPEASASPFTVTIKNGTPEPNPEDADILYSGKLRNEGHCEFAHRNENYYLSFPNQAHLMADIENRHATIVISPEHPKRSRGSIAPLVIEYALDCDSQHVVHAAGLALPNEGGMVIISAASNTGKTTTSLALAKCGLGFAADDVMVLRPTSAGIVAFGLPRALNVHRNTAAILPWLDVGPRWNENEEQAVVRSTLASSIELENGALPIKAILLLERKEAASIEPIDAAEMLAALVEDNVRSSPFGLTPIQSRRFTMLADMVSKVPTYRTAVGEGLSGIETIANKIKEL